MNILVAIDDLNFAEAAAHVLIAQTKTANTEIRLLHVLDLYPAALAEKMGSEEYPNFILARVAMREEASRFLAQTAEKLRTAGFQTSYSLEEDGRDTREIILDYAEQWPADLVLLGSHGRKGLKRFLLGSVSEAVIRHAPCAVEIVRIPPGR